MKLVTAHSPADAGMALLLSRSLHVSTRTAIANEAPRDESACTLTIHTHVAARSDVPLLCTLRGREARLLIGKRWEGLDVFVRCWSTVFGAVPRGGRLWQHAGQCHCMATKAIGVA